jgi:hypothetical protein
MPALGGECLCGAVQYAYEGPLGAIVHCHCSRCRRWHGAAFRTRVAARRAGFRFTSGEEHVARYDSTDRVTKLFCSTCGSSLITEYRQRDDLIGLPLGGVRGELGDRPTFHIFVGSKADWVELPEGALAYDELPPDASLLHRILDEDS